MDEDEIRMRTEQVEIYSDASNAAVMRHPGRAFPGMLIQGDTLYKLSQMAMAALAGAQPGTDHWRDLKELADDLRSRLDFYSHVMHEHGLKLPFSSAGE
jgi:predicted RNase H-like HicB family nuclease